MSEGVSVSRTEFIPRHPHSMRNPIRRIFSRLREARFAAGRFKGLLLAPVWIVRRRYLVLERDVSTHLPADSDTPPLAWEQLSGEGLAEILDANPEADPKEILERQAEGQICYAWRDEGRMIHYRWYATGPSRLPFLELTWFPEDGDYTALGAFTHPGHRGRGVHNALVQQGLARARALGLRRVVSFVAEWNSPSIRVAVRAGLRQSGTVTLWTLGWIRWHSCSGSARLSQGRLRVESE